ncbi:MAG: ComF family protein [Clostridia bacterium]|nr:ComF family protein [Clostridia bacterium]
MSILDLFAPPSCVICKETADGGLCPSCRRHLDALFDPHPFRCSGGNGYADSMFTLFQYDSELPRKLILDLKSNGFRDSLLLFRSYMEQAAAREDFPRGIDLVTFCPRTLTARSARGFDQSERLSLHAAEAIGRPFEVLLSRKGLARTQHKLSAARREKNVKDTFRGERKLAGENILLVDDVVTTGATASEAARILKGMGAMRVFVLCLGH